MNFSNIKINKRQKKLINLFLLLFLYVTILSFLCFFDKNLPNNQKEEYNLLNSELHDPILIIGDSGLNSSDVVTGNGTYEDPYVIEDLVINASSANGIEIRNTNAYLIIFNCSIRYGKNNDYSGIYLKNCKNINIFNNELNENYYGIFLEDSSNNNTISNNNCSGNDYSGICLWRSDNNIIKQNLLIDDKYGIYLEQSDFNNISGNIAFDNEDNGILISYSRSNRLWNNNFSNCGLGFSGSSIDHFNSHFINKSNLVNKKPIYYFTNLNNLSSSLLQNVGQLILVNSSDFEVTDLNISEGSIGIGLYFSDNITISNSTTNEHKQFGIHLFNCDNCNVINNTANDCYSGINLYESDYNELINNSISYNGHGLRTSRCAYINLTNNNIIDNIWGFAAHYSKNLTVKSNEITLNNVGIYIINENYNNSIFANMIYANTQGVYIRSSNNTRVVGNIIENNDENFYESNSYDILKNWNAVEGYVQPICIDDLGGGDFTWENCKAHLAWCTGSGTQIDPYIIENIKIDGENSSSCIEIKNSNVYFKIINCSFFNTSSLGNSAGIYMNSIENGMLIDNNFFLNNYGIFLDNLSSNNSISDNNVYNNSQYGIYLKDSSDNELIENIVTNNNRGIVDLSGNMNNITSNVINYNEWGAITIGYSNNDTISKNSAKNNRYGIVFSFNCYYNYLLNNILDNNTYGIYIPENNEDNIISKNLIKNSFYDGILIENNKNNIITHNNLSKNNNHGVMVYFSNNTLIFNNNFINNSQNAQDDGFNNQWDNGTIGNYWDDYSGEDLDNDGIGDTPYTISGSAGTQDNYPLWDDGPTITILFPTHDQEFGFDAPNFNVSINDPELDTMWYSLNKGQNITFIANGTINQAAWDSLPIGIVELKFYANDTSGNIALKAINITKILPIFISPIFIDGLDPMNDWNNCEVIIGNGTSVNPYVIANFIINSSSAHGIYIRNTKAYFIIHNCTIKFGGSNYNGIHLSNCTNGNLTNNLLNYNYNGIESSSSNNINILWNNCSNNQNDGIIISASSKNVNIWGNNCSNNQNDGIVISASSKNIVSDNTCSNNTRGIFLHPSNDNIISNNSCLANEKYGIFLHTSNNNTIKDNICLNGSNIGGISLSFSNYNNITANNCINNSNGITIGYSNNNTISNNNCSSNIYRGIYFFSSSSNNTINGNYLSYNDYYGIYLDSSNNTIHSNNLIKNNNNAQDDGLNNQWDNGTIGNYWDDYYGEDINDDGIGDVVYSISGSAGAQDNFPIILSGSDNPIWIETPSDQLIEFYTIFNYDVNGSDYSGIDRYWINDSINFQIDNDGLIQNNTILNVGVYWLNISLFDPYNNSRFTIINITVQDTTKPHWINPPTDQTLEFGNDLKYYCNCTDFSGVDQYWINDSINFEIDIHGLISNKTQLGIGEHFINLTIYDPYENYCSEIIKITIEPLSPPIWNVNPSDIVFKEADSLRYNINASDLSGIDFYWINDTSHFQVDENGVITSLNTLSPGEYWIEVRAYDPNGLYCSEVIKITITASSSGIAPSQIEQLLSIILIIIVVISIISGLSIALYFYRDKVGEFLGDYITFTRTTTKEIEPESYEHLEETYEDYNSQEPVPSPAERPQTSISESIEEISPPQDIIILKRIFLSYSSKDFKRFHIAEVAEKLEEYPQVEKVYYYDKDSGQNIVEYMEETLDKCNVFILFCSKNAKKSHSVKGEWQAAYQLLKKNYLEIIPVYEYEEYIPNLLTPFLNVRYDGNNMKEFIEKTIRKLREIRISPRETKADKVSLKRDFDYKGGLVRYKIVIENYTEMAVHNLTASLKMTAEHIRIIDIKPRVYRQGDYAQIHNMDPQQTLSIEFYLEPLICGKIMVYPIVNYIDAFGKAQQIIKDPLKVLSKCPVVVEVGERNIANVKHIFEDKNRIMSYRSFEIKKDIDNTFNILREAVGSWAGKSVSEPLVKSEKPFIAELYYVILDKYINEDLGYREQIIIKLRISEKDNVAIVYVSAEKNETVNGVLTHLWDLINKKFGEVFGYELKSLRCPQCGASLEHMDKDTKTIKCRYCETVFKKNLL